MSNIESATSMENNVVATNENATSIPTVAKTKKAPVAKAKAKAKAKTPEAKEIILDEVAEAPAKEKTIRISKAEKVQVEIQKQFGISEVQFWKFVAMHKPGKMNANKFADSLVQRAFFDREKLEGQLKG